MKRALSILLCAVLILTATSCAAKTVPVSETVRLYVSGGFGQADGGASVGAYINALNNATDYTGTCVSVLSSRSFFEFLASQDGIAYSAEQLRSMITVSRDIQDRVLHITVQGTVCSAFGDLCDRLPQACDEFVSKIYKDVSLSQI